MDIVDRIRDASKGTSLTKIEEALSFGNGTIGKWSKQDPSCKKVELVANYLGTSVEYLITGQAPKTPQLNKTEIKLLEIFRQLDNDTQNEIIGIIKGYFLRNNEDKAKEDSKLA